MSKELGDGSASRRLRLRSTRQAEVPLPRVGQHRHDVLARAELTRDLQRGRDGGAGADPHEEPFAPSQRALHAPRVAIGHREDAIDDRAVVVAGDEPGREALDLGGPALAARQGGARLRLDGRDLRTARGSRAERTAQARPTPDTVPPVPTPTTNASIDAPSMASRISRAVVASWAAGLARFSELLRHEGAGVSAAMAFARSIAPSICASAGVRTTSAPNASGAGVRLMLSGMVSTQQYP